MLALQRPKGPQHQALSPPFKLQPLSYKPLSAPQRSGVFFGALSSALLLLAFGCTNPSTPDGCDEQERRDPLSACYEPCEVGEACQGTPSAHSLDCLDTTGPLCLLEVSWRDELPRRGAITPGEQVMIEGLTLANEGDEPLSLAQLALSAATTHLSLVDGGALILSPLGEGCEGGLIEPHARCEVSLSAPLSVSEEAPLDQQQALSISVSYEQAGAQHSGALSFPLLIIDPAQGVSLGEVELDDSTQDGALNPGDRVRFSSIELLNHSLAPFEALTAHVSSSSELLRPVGRGEMWSDAEGTALGLTTEGLVRCEAAQQSAAGRLPSACRLELSEPFELSDEAQPGDVIELEVRLKERDERVGEALRFSLEVSPLRHQLLFEGLTLNSDEDQDGLLAPGERVTFHELTLLNMGSSALSLQGRLSVDDERVEVLSGGDLSVDLRAQEGEFYERCAPGERCVASVRLRLQLSPELEEGDEVLVSVELMDQSGQRYELSAPLLISRPHVQLELEELRVTQDTLDERLSGGERGLISYIKLINTGDADAIGLTGEVWSDSPYLSTSEGEAMSLSVPLTLHEMSSSPDGEVLGRCLSTQRDREAYCYQRLNGAFYVSPEAPLGEVITFWVELVDELGQAHQLSYELELF